MVYSHPLYAKSLAEFGTPQELPRCGGWVLKRPIAGFEYYDAMGCYPLFSCRDWSKLSADINDLRDSLVSLSLVTDPFGDIRENEIASFFDVFFLFKQHYVTDLSQPIEQTVRKRYQQYARKALEEVSIEFCSQPMQYLLEWMKLYNFLICRHRIRGIRAFSEQSFRILFSIPGVEMFIARHKQEVIGADIWLVDGAVGYAHLSAVSPKGYELRAPYALYWNALNHYAKSLRWLSHGAGAGLDEADEGLAVFKKGWATGTKPVFFCGKILDKEKYAEVSASIAAKKTDKKYFPEYRVGEFS